jgi:hypothetical protein
MTFATLDDLMAFFEQFADDKMRAFETDMLTRDRPDLTDDVCDVIDGAREWHAEAMDEWRVDFRRQLSELPLRFPLTIHFSGLDAARQRS